MDTVSHHWTHCRTISGIAANVLAKVYRAKTVIVCCIILLCVCDFINLSNSQFAIAISAPIMETVL